MNATMQYYLDLSILGIFIVFRYVDQSFFFCFANQSTVILIKAHLVLISDKY